MFAIFLLRALLSYFFFPQYRLILAKAVLFYSPTASSYSTDSFPFSTSDQTAFFTQIPTLTLHMQHRYLCSLLLIYFWVFTWHKVQSFRFLNLTVFSTHHAENLIPVPFSHSVTLPLPGLHQSSS